MVHWSWDMCHGTRVMGQQVDIGVMGQGVGATGRRLYGRGHRTGS